MKWYNLFLLQTYWRNCLCWDDRNPINVVNSSMVICGCEKISWHWILIFVNFSSIRNKVIFKVFIINQKTFIFCVGSRTDFLAIIIKTKKPKSWSRNRAIGNFNSFVKVCASVPDQNKGKEIRTNFSIKQIWHLF